MVNCQITTCGRLTIPKELVAKYAIKKGDILIVEDNGKGFTVSPADVVKKKV